MRGIQKLDRSEGAVSSSQGCSDFSRVRSRPSWLAANFVSRHEPDSKSPAKQPEPVLSRFQFRRSISIHDFGPYIGRYRTGSRQTPSVKRRLSKCEPLAEAS